MNVLFKPVILLWMITSFSVMAHTTAKVERISLVGAGNIVYVFPEGGVQNAPACHGSNGDYLTFKMDRPMAKEYLSLLMMAFTAEKTVSFRTAADCVEQSVSETLDYLWVDN